MGKEGEGEGGREGQEEAIFNVLFLFFLPSSSLPLVDRRHHQLPLPARPKMRGKRREGKGEEEVRRASSLRGRISRPFFPSFTLFGVKRNVRSRPVVHPKKVFFRGGRLDQV